MDTFTFLLAVIFLMMAVQWQQNWLVIAIVVVMILYMRSIKATVGLIIALAVLYILRDSIAEYALYIIIGMVILALIIGFKEKQAEPEYYSPDMLGGLMGGGMGGGM